MYSVSVKLNGIDELIAKLDVLHDAMVNGPGVDAMRELGEAAMEDIDTRFETQGYWTWPALSPITIAKKGHDQILIDTTTMRDSVGIGELSESKVSVTVPYGGEERDPDVPKRHQTGFWPTNLPQRKIVEDTPVLRSRIRVVMLDWLKKWRSGALSRA